MFNCSLVLPNLIIINVFLIPELYSFLCRFTCLCFSTQGIYIMDVFSPPHNVVLPTCWSECFVLFLCWSFHHLTLLPSVWIILASTLPYRCMSCVPARWKSQVYIWYSTNLPFFSFLLFLLSSCFLSFLSLPQSVSTANLSETACFLMSWS